MERASSLPKVLFVGASIIGIAIILFAIIQYNPHSSVESKGPIAIENTLDRIKLKYGEPVTIRTKITNALDTDQTVTFPNSCTQPTLLVDYLPQTKSPECAQVVTPFILRAGDSKTYTLNLIVYRPTNLDIENQGVTITLGKHQLFTRWGNALSEPLDIEVEE